MAPQMDFGYSQSAPDDVEECCLRWPHPTYVWSTSTHYSTRDCLYEALGQMTLANSSVVFSGDARAVSLDAIGAPPELKQFSQLSCDANGTRHSTATNRSALSSVRVGSDASSASSSRAIQDLSSSFATCRGERATVSLLIAFLMTKTLKLTIANTTPPGKKTIQKTLRNSPKEI